MNGGRLCPAEAIRISDGAIDINPLAGQPPKNSINEPRFPSEGLAFKSPDSADSLTSEIRAMVDCPSPGSKARAVSCLIFGTIVALAVLPCGITRVPHPLEGGQIQE